MHRWLVAAEISNLVKVTVVGSLTLTRLARFRSLEKEGPSWIIDGEVETKSDPSVPELLLGRVTSPCQGEEKDYL